MPVKLQIQQGPWVTDQISPEVPINAITATLMRSSYERPEQPPLASGKAPVGGVSRLPGRSPVGPQLKWKGGRLAIPVALGVCGSMRILAGPTTQPGAPPAVVRGPWGSQALPADGFSSCSAEVPALRVGVAAGGRGEAEMGADRQRLRS